MPPNVFRVMKIVVKKFRFRSFSNIFFAFLTALPVVFVVKMVHRDPLWNLNDNVSKTRISLEASIVNQNDTLSSAVYQVRFPDSEVNVLQFTSNSNMPEAKLLGGLLSPGFNDSSCLSRYRSFLYRKSSPHKPSGFLLSRLRTYERLHRRCGPHTKSYNKTLEQLALGNNISSPTGCNYVVWIAYSGLGNRIVTIASAFLYALLTDRVLLIDQQPEMGNLFCEPFPNTSWLLPMDFPFRNEFKDFDQNYAQSYGNMLKYHEIIDSLSNELLSVSYIYLHLAHDSDKHDKLFFCDQDQALLRDSPWLFIRTDSYLVPALFMIPSFEQQLNKLFPDKEAVFHHLGRYLFHSSNQVWGLITRYYQAYMARANERIGIQIRVFRTLTTSYQSVMNQVWACTLKEKLLPQVDFTKSVSLSPAKTAKISKAVLITSLYPEYFENISNMYWAHPTVTGEVMEVYQPSHEGHQKTEDNLHNMKAWAEMNLLSMCDVLVTSSWSTFGYVAQGLAGLKPWILHNIKKRKPPDPPCSRVMSMEPCFHSPPVYDNCKTRTKVNTGSPLPYVRHCEDMLCGLKLFNRNK